MKPHYPPKAQAAGSAEVTRGPCPSLKAAGGSGTLQFRHSEDVGLRTVDIRWDL